MKSKAMTALTLVTAALCVSGGSADPRTPQNQSRLFDPLHQRPLSYADESLTINVVVRGGRISLDIRQGPRPISRELPLPDDMAQVNEIRRTQPNKVVVIGMFSGDIWEVVVVELSGPSITDKFLCYEPSVSPDGRYVSFIKFFPPHSADGAEDHYMLYNLRKDAAHNRPAGTNKSDWQTVGVTIYPPGIGNHNFDNLHHPESAIHMLSSDGFFWDNAGSQVVFADSSKAASPLFA